MNTKLNYCFASDNCSAAHPDVINYISDISANAEYSYGYDSTTREADRLFHNIFGRQAAVFYALTGTGANVMSLACILNGYQGVICPESAHINVDECGAPERFTGSKIISVPTTDGKLRPEDISAQMSARGFEHHSQPAAVSISQATEMGTVYTAGEIKKISEICKDQGLYLHMDGARIANAAAAADTDVCEMSAGCGVDILSFGGTKNGLMIGEAVVVFNEKLAENMKYIRKQTMQLASKMRYVSGQFVPYLKDGLYLENARRANSAAKYLAEGLKSVQSVSLVSEPVINSVFFRADRELAEKLLEKYFFYTWDEQADVYRLMCSYSTDKNEIDEFISYLRSLS